MEERRLPPVRVAAGDWAYFPKIRELCDLRFGSGLAFVRRLLAMRPHADIPFQLMVELAPAGRNDGEGASPRLERLRLRFSDSGRDSRWHAPEPPAPPTFVQWLVGLR